MKYCLIYYWEGRIIKNFDNPVVKIVICFRVTLELKVPFLIGLSDVSQEQPFCINLSVKNVKNFSEPFAWQFCNILRNLFLKIPMSNCTLE